MCDSSQELQSKIEATLRDLTPPKGLATWAATLEALELGEAATDIELHHDGPDTQVDAAMSVPALAAAIQNPLGEPLDWDDLLLNKPETHERLCWCIAVGAANYIDDERRDDYPVEQYYRPGDPTEWELETLQFWAEIGGTLLSSYHGREDVRVCVEAIMPRDHDSGMRRMIDW